MRRRVVPSLRPFSGTAVARSSTSIAVPACRSPSSIPPLSGRAVARSFTSIAVPAYLRISSTVFAASVQISIGTPARLHVGATALDDASPLRLLEEVDKRLEGKVVERSAGRLRRILERVDELSSSESFIVNACNVPSRADVDDPLHDVDTCAGQRRSLSTSKRTLDSTSPCACSSLSWRSSR